jgi:putative ABC transport system ATP-binding protein
MTVVLVTHDPEVARHAARVVRFRDGRIVGDMRQVPVAADAGTKADAAANTAPEEAALP